MVALVLLAIVAFYLAFRILKQYFIINNNPVSKIRSAAQGYVEVEGIQAFLPGKTLQAPISKVDCTWYWYMIEELKKDYRGRSYWHEKESGESDEHFMLIDTTGQCIICPEGADVFTTIYRVWIDKDNPKLRYTEHLLTPNKYVYITGVFRTLDSSSSSSEFFEKHKQVSELIKKWKQDYSGLLQKFDADQNKQLDKDEWENVIKSAEQQISNQYSTAVSEDTSSKVMQQVNIISKEGRMLDEPFLISTLRKKEVIKKFYGKFIFYLIVFFISAVGTCTVDVWYYLTLVKLNGGS